MANLGPAIINCITVASLAPRELCKRFLPSFLLEGGRSGWPEEASGSPAIV